MVNSHRRLWLTVHLACFMVFMVNLGTASNLSAQDSTADTNYIISVSNCRVMVIQEAKVGTERAGILESVKVFVGDTVKKDQILATLRDDLVQASLLISRKEASNDIELRFAKKVSELARLEYIKALQLNKEIPNAHSELTLSGLRLAAERGLLQIEQAAHRMEITRLRYAEAHLALKSYVIRAPFDGIVKRVNKFSGEAVREGDAIVEIVNYDRLRVEADFKLRDALQIERGREVQIEIDLSDIDLPVEKTRFIGRIVFIDAQVQDLTQKVHVRADVENHQNLLKAGLTATMRVARPSSKTKIRLSNSLPTRADR